MMWRKEVAFTSPDLTSLDFFLSHVLKDVVKLIQKCIKWFVEMLLIFFSVVLDMKGCILNMVNSLFSFDNIYKIS